MPRFRRHALRLGLVLAFVLTTAFGVSARAAIEHDRGEARHEAGQSLQSPIASGSFSALSEERPGRGEQASRSGAANGDGRQGRRVQAGRDRSDADGAFVPERPQFGVTLPTIAAFAGRSRSVAEPVAAHRPIVRIGIATPPVGSLAPPRA